MEHTQLIAKISAQAAPLDAVNAKLMVPLVLLARPISIYQDPHAHPVPLVTMRLLNQLIPLHALLVRMKAVLLVVQVTPQESVPSVMKANSPLQVFARIAQIPNVLLVLDLELENVLLVKLAIT